MTLSVKGGEIHRGKYNNEWILKGRFIQKKLLTAVNDLFYRPLEIPFFHYWTDMDFVNDKGKSVLNKGTK